MVVQESLQLLFKLVMRKSVLLFYLLAVVSCNGSFGDAPEIAIEQVGPTSVVQFKDSIYMRISFYDPNGDLGENLVDENNLFVVDNRLDLTHEYRISNMVPGGAQVPIQGELEWTIGGLFLTNTSNQPEDVTYTIYVIDRAGNQSNILTTDPIEILP